MKRPVEVSKPSPRKPSQALASPVVNQIGEGLPTPPPESQLRFPALSTLLIGHLDSWDHHGSHSCLLSPPPEPGRWAPATEAPPWGPPILNPTGHEILYI